MKLSYSIVLLLFLLFIPPKPVLAQDSLISTIIEKNESIVTVRAIKLYRPQLGDKKFFRVPKTNQIIHRSQIKVPSFERRGAGVIIDESGLIVTNLHTIRGSEKIIVTLFDQNELEAEIMQMLPKRDLALLKITPSSSLVPIEFSKFDQVKLGDSVINVGHSKLLKKTISGGRITRLGTTNEGGTIEFIQVNINLYKGDSGGPLLDQEGRLVGMMVADVRGVDRASIAVSADEIKELYAAFLLTQ